MRRLLLLVALCLVGVLVISSAAFADQHTASAMMGSASASAMGSASAMMTASPTATATATATASATALPASGGPIGPSLLGLMAGAMLLGSGVVSLAIVRRRI